MATVYLAGSGWFGWQAAEHLAASGHRIVGVSSPAESRRNSHGDLLAGWAHRAGVPWSDAQMLGPGLVLPGTDLIMAAHSHAYIGARTRSRARYALGYHPSLLPLHRGRDAVKWQARLLERVVGGTVYHLTRRIDGGPIALQEHAVIRPPVSASDLWRDVLAPMGLRLIVAAAGRVDAGEVGARRQDDKAATWEPSLDAAPLHRPELWELPRGSS